VYKHKVWKKISIKGTKVLFSKIKISDMTEPTLITDAYGDKEWRLDGKLHREGGPAVEWRNGYNCGT
jgi:hypothetical protein